MSEQPNTDTTPQENSEEDGMVDIDFNVNILGRTYSFNENPLFTTLITTVVIFFAFVVLNSVFQLATLYSDELTVALEMIFTGVLVLFVAIGVLGLLTYTKYRLTGTAAPLGKTYIEDGKFVLTTIGLTIRVPTDTDTDQI